MAEVKPFSTLERDFSKIVITLDNVLIPEDKSSPTPSMQDGLDLETEIYLRILGCELIQTSGILLKLPQVAMATGQVLFQRFYYSKSFVKHNMEVLAMACVNLASKIEECPRRIRDVLNIFHHIKQVQNQKTIHPMVLDHNYINLKNQVIKAERRVLKELGFCVHVKHPHKVIVMFLQVLDQNENRKLVQCAWQLVLGNTYVPQLLVHGIAAVEIYPYGRNYMNDSFRTDVFVRWHPETIACACIWLAARQLQIALPNNPAWYELFNVDDKEIQEICLTILRLYARKKPNPEALEEKVNFIRNIQIEAKKKAKGLLSEKEISSSIPAQNSPKNVSPHLLTIINERKKRIKTKEKSDSVGKRRNGLHGSRSRSLSRSGHSSGSFSPAPKKHKRHAHRSKSPSHRSKKDDFSSDLDSKDVHKSRKQKHQSKSDSYSSSDDKASHKKHSYNKDHDSKARAYADKERYYSLDRHSRKHRNGHYLSPAQDRVDKYDKYGKYRR